VSEVYLTAQYTLSTQRNSRLAYLLKAEIIESEYLPQEVFVYQANASDDEAFFVAVADLLDIEETPINEVDLEDDNPFFRMNYVELYFRSLEELIDNKDIIDEYLSNLVREKARIDSDTIDETKQYTAEGSIPLPSADGFIYGQRWVTMDDGIRRLAYLFPDDSWKVIMTTLEDGVPSHYWKETIL